MASCGLFALRLSGVEVLSGHQFFQFKRQHICKLKFGDYRLDAGREFGDALIGLKCLRYAV